MRILVTGTEGYLGCLLAPHLLRLGHDVIGVDASYYVNGWLYHGVDTTARTLVRDVRHLTADDLAGADAVVHLAELSNDPLGELSPEITYAVNHHGSVRLARLAREAGVSRFVYTSSCSVYGVADGLVDETSPVNPQTAYAHCKALVERDVAQLADESFSPTFLRNATAFGASPRMRFDVVLNNLAGLAWTTRRIALTSDGTPWRPLVHALDIARAVTCVLDAPAEAVRAQTFNVGATDHNYPVREIAEVVGEVFPGCEVSFGPPGADNRSYRVSFDKISSQLGFTCAWDLHDGARQLYDVFSAIGLDEATFGGRGHTRLKQLKHLIATHQVDAELFWTTQPGELATPPSAAAIEAKAALAGVAR